MRWREETWKNIISTALSSGADREDLVSSLQSTPSRLDADGATLVVSSGSIFVVAHCCSSTSPEDFVFRTFSMEKSNLKDNLRAAKEHHPGDQKHDTRSYQLSSAISRATLLPFLWCRSKSVDGIEGQSKDPFLDVRHN